MKTIEFHYYTNGYRYHQEPAGFMSINLDYILLYEGDSNTKKFPIGNMKKVFKVLHEMTAPEVRENNEKSIAWWLKCTFESMKAKEHFSKKDEKIMKRLESINSAFLKSCKWEENSMEHFFEIL